MSEFKSCGNCFHTMYWPFPPRCTNCGRNPYDYIPKEIDDEDAHSKKREE